jgi:hypothetical protein
MSSKDIKIMEMFKNKIHGPYLFMLLVYAGFIIFAFAIEEPYAIGQGLFKILTSQSILFTDYIAVGGLSATLVNSAIAGSASILMLMVSKLKPSGSIIMALWLTTGFAFFGKNLFNMLPITCGVWLYSRFKKEPFVNFSLAAILVATIAPAVSEIAFLGIFPQPVEIVLGIFFGLFVGFIFPAISAYTVRLHGGYDLYNMGFSGGLITLVLISLYNNQGIVIESPDIFSSGNNVALAVGLYIISAAMFCYGLIFGNTKKILSEFIKIHKHPGRLVSDFYYQHGNSVYINMAVLCVFATTFTLLIGAELNGPSIAGILTIVGFGSFGKHLKNVVPIMIGAVAANYMNGWNPGGYSNIVTVLLATGLAPIAGHYGLFWGVIAGFLHVNVASHTSYLSGGMNLYNNGFAAGFVAMLMIPLITAFRKGDTSEN